MQRLQMFTFQRMQILCAHFLDIIHFFVHAERGRVLLKFNWKKCVLSVSCSFVRNLNQWLQIRCRGQLPSEGCFNVCWQLGLKVHTVLVFFRTHSLKFFYLERLWWGEEYIERQSQMSNLISNEKRKLLESHVPLILGFPLQSKLWNTCFWL